MDDVDNNKAATLGIQCLLHGLRGGGHTAAAAVWPPSQGPKVVDEWVSSVTPGRKV